jgi:plastocyanin
MTLLHMNYRLLIAVACLTAVWNVPVGAETEASQGAEEAEPNGAATGRVVGRVIYEGRVARSWVAPEIPWSPPEVSLEAEPDAASAPSPPAIQVTADGAVRDVAVWLESDAARAAVRSLDAPPVVIDQVGSVFWPQMVVMPRGGRLLVKNSDGINHNVHLLSHRQEKNFLLRAMEEREMQLRHSDEIRVTCDLHAWMRSSLVIVETPYYAVTGADGDFVIENVPAGAFELKIAHHRFKAEPTTVEILAGETTELVIRTALGTWDH